jgi:hypothetical protein
MIGTPKKAMQFNGDVFKITNRINCIPGNSPLTIFLWRFRTLISTASAGKKI